jgi:hypothetical protein
MADNKDELAARRLFRKRLDELATQYPQLIEPVQQERLAVALHPAEEIGAMARIPIGRGRGRPKGSGSIGADQVRLTVRIPRALFDRLEAYAEGRRFYRAGEGPKLAGCVREALEHYLVCPDKRQTKIVVPSALDSAQTANDALVENRQAEMFREAGNQVDGIPALERQASEEVSAGIDLPEGGEVEREGRGTGTEPEGNIRQTENRAIEPTVPSFDTAKYELGKLCPRGHDYHGTGKSLRRLPRHVCLQCDAEGARERRKARRQAVM